MIYLGCYFSISFTGLSLSNQPLNVGDPQGFVLLFFLFSTSFPWEEVGQVLAQTIIIWGQ